MYALISRDENRFQKLVLRKSSVKKKSSLKDNGNGLRPLFVGLGDAPIPALGDQGHGPADVHAPLPVPVPLQAGGPEGNVCPDSQRGNRLDVRRLEGLSQQKFMPRLTDEHIKKAGVSARDKVGNIPLSSHCLQPRQHRLQRGD